MTYYVVHKGHIPGIYPIWKDCKKQIDNYKNPIFKKCTTEKEAKLFLEKGFDNKKPSFLVKKENTDNKNNSLIEIEEDNTSSKIFIYTDGSFMKLKNNTQIAGYGIYIPSKNISVSKPLLNQKLTNNRAELTAIIESIDYLDEEELAYRICIFTDSQYSMYIFNGTGERYESNQFIEKGKQVPNVDLIQKILKIKRSYNITLLKVRAHTDKKDIHSIHNEIADKLANDGALSSLNNKESSDHNNIFQMNSKSDYVSSSSSKSDYVSDSKSNYVSDSKSDYVSDSDSDSELKSDHKKKKNEKEENKINYDVYANSTKMIGTIIDKNITMNELFECSESTDGNKISKKKTKLSKWFIEVKI